MIKKGIVLDRPKFCWSGSMVRHLFLKTADCFIMECCSNYIFVLDPTSGSKGFGKDSRKTVRESIMCWDLVHLILENRQYFCYISDFEYIFDDQMLFSTVVDEAWWNILAFWVLKKDSCLNWLPKQAANVYCRKWTRLVPQILYELLIQISYKHMRLFFDK